MKMKTEFTHIQSYKTIDAREGERERRGEREREGGREREG